MGKVLVERIPKNHGTIFPSRVVFVDTETFPEGEGSRKLHKLRLAVAELREYKGGALVRRTSPQVFHKVEDFWAWLFWQVHRGQSLWVVAHNMDFDFGVLGGFVHVPEHGFEPVFFGLNWGSWFAVFRKDGATVRFVDSLAIFRESIEELGQKVELPKLSMPEEGEPLSRWEEYCARDVEILGEAFTHHMAYVAENDLGSLRMTIPGQAFTAYRHRFMEEPIWVHHFERVQNLERRAFFGGRCECFWIGKVPASPVYVLDVEGMYGSVMHDEVFPTRLVGMVENPSFREVEKLSRDFELLGVVELEAQEPAFPVRARRLLFPLGRITTSLPGPEFLYALHTGQVRKIYRVLVYTRGRPFVGYTEFFFREKISAEKRGDRLSRTLAKLFLNSLYGKFGERRPKLEVGKNLLREPPSVEYVFDAKTRKFTIRIPWGGKVFIEEDDLPSKYAFYPIAAWVTSYARIRLYNLIKRAGEGHVFYCDTDSLMVDEEGLKRLQDEVQPGVPGKLKVEKEAKEVVIYGPKDYELDGTSVVKGVPRWALEVESGRWRFLSFERAKTRLRKGVLEGIPEVQRERTRRGRYEKGQVHDDGRVTPWVFTGAMPAARAPLPPLPPQSPF
jgi:hypothetical protein